MSESIFYFNARTASVRYAAKTKIKAYRTKLVDENETKGRE